MPVNLIRRGTIVEVEDLEGLQAAARRYSPKTGTDMLIKCFRLRKPLTSKQFDRLPKWLQEMVDCTDGSLDWLEALYRLEDLRRPVQ